MKMYEVTLIIHDCTNVDAENEDEARDLAIDIFKQEGYDLGRSYELEVEEIVLGEVIR